MVLEGLLSILQIVVNSRGFRFFCEWVSLTTRGSFQSES